MASLKRRYLGCTGIRLQKREAGVGVDTADRSSSMRRHRGRRDTSHLRDIIVIGNGEFGAGSREQAEKDRIGAAQYSKEFCVP